MSDLIRKKIRFFLFFFKNLFLPTLIRILFEYSNTASSAKYSNPIFPTNPSPSINSLYLPQSHKSSDRHPLRQHVYKTTQLHASGTAMRHWYGGCFLSNGSVTGAKIAWQRQMEECIKPMRRDSRRYWRHRSFRCTTLRASGLIACGRIAAQRPCLIRV